MIMKNILKKIKQIPRWIQANIRHLSQRRNTANTSPIQKKEIHIIPDCYLKDQKNKRGRRTFRIRNKRRAFIAAGSLLAVCAAIVLLVTLTGQDKSVALAESAAAAAVPTQTESVESSVTLMTPVYTSISISDGITASVITDIQLRLMELEYMDEDEPDGVYGDQTKEAIEHFQEQHELTVDGIVNQETYSLLFSSEAQTYTISIGAENTDVYELQERLCELDYISKATGYFGTETEAAVEKFQKMNGLVEDGKVGKNTRELLYSADAVANAFSYGEQSDEILEYQQRLQELGYLTTEPDGTFGEDTKAAVERFQESNGLIADGYIGPKTQEALMSSDAQGNALSIGAQGDDVTSVQERLQELNYLSKATGYFGSDTDTAVRSFQYNNGLSVDGKVGAVTMNALMSSSAKKSTGSNVTGANVESFISVAESKLGSTYVRGGKGPTVFDCSGFAYWCLNQVGIKQSYLTSYGWRSCTKYTKITSMNDLKRGDIIIYYGHVAICAGNGYMIDASSSNGKVVKRKYTNSSYWSRNFYCAFRVF